MSVAASSVATHRGGCLCGAVKYVVDGAFARVTHCHCSMRRKGHGAAFATYATVRVEQLQFECGETALSHFQSSPTVIRSFYRHCGSPMFWRDDTREPGMVTFALGAWTRPAWASASPISRWARKRPGTRFLITPRNGSDRAVLTIDPPR